MEHVAEGMGKRHLTGLAFEVEPEEVSDAEADFALLMTKLLTNLTESDRTLLAEVMLKAVTSRDPKLSIFNKTKPPTSVKDFKQWFLMHPKSIVKNLPQAVTNKTKCGKQTFLKPSDVLANLMASGTDFCYVIYNP